MARRERRAAATRYRLDDLRRLATSLARGPGRRPARASSLATHLLWFDAAGASSHGIATLPTWLDRIDRKEIDPVAEGRARLEHSGTAVFDAQNGLAPLALARAAGIASEKARDVGVGIVRVRNLGPSGPAAPVAADLAIGPFVGADRRARALDRAGRPDARGAAGRLRLGARPAGPRRAARAGSGLGPLGRGALGRRRLGDPGPGGPGDGAALPSFHERVAGAFRGAAEGPGTPPRRLGGPSPRGPRAGRPARRRRRPASGRWAERLGVPWPAAAGRLRPAEEVAMVLPLGDIEKTRIVPVATYVLIALNMAMYLVESDLGETFKASYAATPYEITHDFDIDRPVRAPRRARRRSTGSGRSGAGQRDRARAGPVPGLADDPDVDVPPRQPAAPGREHAVPLDLRRQRRGGARDVPLRPGLPRCGVAGSLAQIARGADSLIPTLGASGAIAGVMGAYIVWFPHNRVRVLFFNFLTVMPAFLVIGVWIVLQIVRGYGSIGHLGEVGGVAYLAHIGGAAAGLVVALLFRDRAIAVQAEAYRDRGPATD